MGGRAGRPPRANNSAIENPSHAHLNLHCHLQISRVRSVSLDGHLGPFALGQELDQSTCLVVTTPPPHCGLVRAEGHCDLSLARRTRVHGLDSRQARGPRIPPILCPGRLAPDEHRARTYFVLEQRDSVCNHHRARRHQGEAARPPVSPSVLHPRCLFPTVHSSAPIMEHHEHKVVDGP